MQCNVRFNTQAAHKSRGWSSEIVALTQVKFGTTWRREERGGEIGGGAKGNRRRITKECDWRQKEV
eukprot:COSAG02_NODE_7092_length_3189_cov_2.683172_5_plen_65_part_01